MPPTAPPKLDPKEQKQRDAAEKLLKDIDAHGQSIDEIKQQLAQVMGVLDPFMKPDAIDLNKSVQAFEEFKAQMEKHVARIAQGHPQLRIPGLEDEKERSKFSIIRAICGAKTHDWDKYNAQYEKEVMEEYRQKLGQVGGVQSAGGYIIPEQVIPDIVLRILTRSALINLTGEGTSRVTVLDGLVGHARIPKVLGGVVAYWIGEEDDFVESRMSFGDLNMTPKKLGILVKLTEEMRKFASFGFENMLRNDMVREAARKLDYTLLYGRGSDNEPRGITNAFDAAKIAQIEAGADINKNDSIRIFRAETKAPWDGSTLSDNDGAEMNFDHLDEFMGMLEDRNIETNESFAWIFHPRFKRRLRQLKVDQYSSQTTNQSYLLGSPMLTDAELQALIGSFGTTTQIPTKNKPGASAGFATDATGEKYTDVFGGNWSEMILARWGGIEIDTDEGKGKGFVSDTIYTKLRMLCDTAWRHAAAIGFAPDAKVRD